jgi:hypothetical protein
MSAALLPALAEKQPEVIAELELALVEIADIIDRG